MSGFHRGDRDCWGCGRYVAYPVPRGVTQGTHASHCSLMDLLLEFERANPDVDPVDALVGCPVWADLGGGPVRCDRLAHHDGDHGEGRVAAGGRASWAADSLRIVPAPAYATATFGAPPRPVPESM